MPFLWLLASNSKQFSCGKEEELPTERVLSRWSLRLEKMSWCL